MNHRACPSKSLAFSAFFAALFALLPFAARPAAAQAVTVQLRDASGWTASSFQEFQPITLRVADSGRAGAGSIEALFESTLRGDAEWVVLDETPAASGIFTKVMATAATLDPAPPAQADGTLEVAELAGPPLERDTVRLSYPDCSLAPCPSAQAAMTGGALRLVDAFGYDLATARPAFHLYIEATAHWADAQPTLEVTVGGGGESETVTLQKVSGAGRFAGSKFVDYGAAVPGDGLLRVSPAVTLTASLPDPLGLSAAADTVAIAENRVRFADAAGNRAFLLMNGPIQVLYESQAANLSPAAPDTYPVGVASLSSGGQRDEETLVLTETGAATGVFAGQIWNEIVTGAGSPGDGLLQAEAQDTIQVSAGAMGIAERMTAGLVRFTDASGADVAEVHPGTVHLEVLSYLANEDENAADEVTVAVETSGNPGDQETLTLTELGADGNLFRGSITALLRAPAIGNSLIEGLQGETLEADLWSGGSPDRALLVADPNDQPPVAVADGVTVAEDSSLTVAALANDYDANGDAMTILSFTANSTAGGQVTTAAAPDDFLYVPKPDFSGTDSFSYTLVANGQNATATVTVTVTPVPDAPVAVFDLRTTPEDVPLTIDVMANDRDADGDALTVDSLALDGQNVTLNPDGTLLFTPAANFYGPASFSYTLRDATGLLSAPASVTVSMTPVNDPPIAVDDVLSVAEDATVTLPVKNNDSDPDSPAPIVQSVTPASHGTVTLISGLVRYKSHLDYSGPDAFTYNLVDSHGATATASVSLTVTPVNDVPIGVADSVTTPEDTPVLIDVLANDVDPDSTLDLSLWSSPTRGTLTKVIEGGRPQYRYVPQANYNGADSFSYLAFDPSGAYSAVTVVSLTVAAVYDPLVLANDAATTAEDTAVTINVLLNDTNIDNLPLTVTASLGAGTTGSVTVNANKTLTYVPGLNYNGNSGFILYQVSDGTTIASARVNLTVTAVNDPPTAVADAAATLEDQMVSIPVLANDSDVEGPVTLYSVGFVANGTAVQGFSSINYTPRLNWSGVETFTYTIRDSSGVSRSASVTVTVTAVNDLPLPLNDSATIAEDTPVTVNVVANDTDADGDALSVSAVQQGMNGSTATFSGGSVTYTPAANYSGPDYVRYTVSDGKGGTASAWLTVTMTAVNDPPNAVADAYTVAEDGSGSFAVLQNDSDVEGQALTVTTAAGAAHGSLTFTATSVGYVPAANYSGPDSFSYTVRDAGGATATGTVTVTVTPVNDLPVAVADTATTDEEVAVTVEVLANDSDADGDSLAVVAVAAGSHGSASFGATSVTFTPTADFSGTATMLYTVGDGHGGTAQGTVTITVTAVDDAPFAVADAYSLAEDGSGTYAVLANDSDADGDSLTIIAAGGATHGAVTFDAGSVSYVPAADWSGSDGFSYTVSDGNGGSATATVSITVTPVNDSPVAVPDAATTDEEAAVTVEVLANDSDADGDSLTIIAAGGASHGSVTFGAGSVTYVPAADWSGSDGFSYTVSDGNGGSATATVSITVTAVNDHPVAVPDAFATSEDTALTFAPLGNDSDADGDALAIEAIGAVTGGSASATATTITFTPAANFSGTATVQFTIGDGHGGSAASAATIAVSPVNDVPVAVPDAGSVAEDGSLTLAVLANDSDVETPGSLAITGVTPAAHGAVGFTSGSVVYTPAANYHGPDAFTYSIADGQGGTATASVGIVVTPVNDAPVALGDSAAVTAGSSVTVAVLANDSDLEGSALTVAAVGAPAHGNAVRNSNDTITYTPAAGYSGPDSFTYTASDGAATATATVSVTVTNALGQVSVLGLRSLQLETGADVLSGDVVVNAAEPPPFLGATEVALGTGTTVAAGWDVRGNGVTIAAGTTIAADVVSNTLANSGTITGAVSSPLALPVFATLPALQTAAPGSSDVNVATNGTISLAPGVYRDLLVAKKGVVTFTGGVYVFRSVVIQREASLLFAAAATVKVEQKMSTATLTQIKPAPAGSATAANIVFHIAGINGTNGALASTPKPLEIATDNVLQANFYVPNGTLWLQARTTAQGAFIGRHVRIGPDVQVSLRSAF